MRQLGDQLRMLILLGALKQATENVFRGKVFRERLVRWVLEKLLLKIRTQVAMDRIMHGLSKVKNKELI
jgi:hypothetical protein